MGGRKGRDGSNCGIDIKKILTGDGFYWREGPIESHQLHLIKLEGHSTSFSNKEEAPYSITIYHAN